MKKFLALVTVVTMLASMCAFTAYAEGEYATELTLSTTAVDNKANVGDALSTLVSLGTSKGLKTLGFKIAFDSNDLELGISENASEYYMNPDYAEECEDDYDGDWEGLTKDYCGHVSYVDDAYYATYKSYVSDEKSLGTATIGVSQNGANTNVAFGYAMDSAIKTAKATADMSVGGIVLKVKTTEKKQTTITLVEASASGKEGVDTPSTIMNEIVLNLNGYGEVVEPEVPDDPYDLKTNYVAAAKDIPVKSTEYGEYNVKTALIFGSSINEGSAEEFGTEITLEGYAGDPLVIKASEAAKYNAGAGITGFTAAVTSIREANLNKTFVAKAYAIDADGKKVYGEEAEAVFSKIAAN